MLKLTKIFGTKNERELRKIEPTVEEIRCHYDKVKELTDQELREKTEEFRRRIAERTQPLRDEISKLDEEAKAAPVDEAHSLEKERDRIQCEQRLAEEQVLLEILPEAYACLLYTSDAADGRG